MYKKIFILLPLIFTFLVSFAQNGNATKLDNTDFAILITLVVALIALALTIVNVFQIIRVKKITKVNLVNSVDDINMSMEGVKVSLTKDINYIKKELNRNKRTHQKKQQDKVLKKDGEDANINQEKPQDVKQERKPSPQNRRRKTPRKPIIKKQNQDSKDE